MTFTLHNTDAIGCASLVADESVHAIVTSPPYYGLRRYAGVPDVTWPDGWRGQLGGEPTPDLYLAHLVEIFRAWMPKLHPSGIAVVNLGDTYASTSKGSGGTVRSTLVGTPNDGNGQLFDAHRIAPGVPPKNLILIPHRFAIAMQADGWILRNECPWVKPNAMPSSVTDRLTVGHEWFLLFAKEQRYYWDAGAVSRGQSAKTLARYGYGFNKTGKGVDPSGASHRKGHGAEVAIEPNPAGRNIRTSDVWLDGLDATIANVADYLDHLREIRDGGGLLTDPNGEPLALYASTKGTDTEHYAAYGAHLVTPWVRAGTPPGGTVADPFAGTGTTLEVAIREGRNAIGCEPSTKYYPDAVRRLEAVAAQPSLFAAAPEKAKRDEPKQGVLL